MAKPISVMFAAGAVGQWRIDRLASVRGDSMPLAPRLAMLEGRGADAIPENAAWVICGTTSNTRYTTAVERDRLTAKQENLGRPQATCAALIPIRKSGSWWDLAQDERRTIFEERSRHIETGVKYLPAIARRLYHCREFGEPFDFLTWFEYASGDADAFEDLVCQLRQTEEWRYVEREVDIRLTRTHSQ